jgi:hypothetical protein
MSTNINWVRVGERAPTNINRDWPGQPETPFVSCLVWVCNPKDYPKYLNGGVPRVIRWDTEKKRWHDPDKIGDYLFDPPYEITHFSDDYKSPGKEVIITNELLKKAGFTLADKGLKKGNFVISDIGSTYRVIYSNVFIRDLKYIHELQNLHYWITGEDLTFEL